MTLKKHLCSSVFICGFILPSACFAEQPGDESPFVAPDAKSDVAPIQRVPWGAAAISPRNYDEALSPAVSQRIQWREWSAETFAEAKISGRAIVLFVSAPWCHAGHIMERTALTDSEVINRLSDEFIPVRLNRDERPDVDMRLQQAIAALDAGHGWPLTIFMTSEGRVFYGGTSYPREDDLATGKAGLRTALRKVEQLLRDGREATLKESAEFERNFQNAFAGEKTAGDIPAGCLDALATKLQSELDEKAGGPAGPKFPTPRALEACLAHYRYANDIKSLHVCTSTLTALLQSSMYDHLAGGFHRCCVDRWWRIPRFEKMLSFNAEMLMLCLHAWQDSKSPRYKDAIAKTIDYWQGMTDRESGLYFNAQTSDVSAVDDGDYFTWTLGELELALRDDNDCKLACAFYGLTESGNLPSSGAGRNALGEVTNLADAGKAAKLDEAGAHARLEKIHALLLAKRQRRPAPPIDRALYVDGNALMASALMECGKALGHPEWTTRGEAVLKTLLTAATAERMGHVFGKDLHVSLIQDEAAILHACAVALETTRDANYVKVADASLARLLKNFWDEKAVCLVDRTEDARPEAETVLNWKVKPWMDTAEPSSAGLAAKACMKLYASTKKEEYRKQARSIVQAFGAIIGKAGAFASTLCSAADELGR
jgi:hypothetical protein